MRRALVVATALVAGAAQAQTGRLAGRVSEAGTGDPIPGATVQAGARGTSTNADGRFEVAGLPAGAAAVLVRSLGYARVDTLVAIRDGETTRLDVVLAPLETLGAEVVVQARRSATATRADAPVLLVPQAVTVLTPAVLEAQGARTASDALRNVPGATTATRGEPVGVPVLRGFQADQTGGGVRRNGTETPYLFDGLAANVERVEVLRGPASVLYGRLEPGGVVNFITKVPRGEQGARVEAEGGTLGSARLAVDAERPVGAVAVRTTVAAQRDGSARDGVATRQLLVAPAVRWRPAPGLVADADVEATLADATIDPGLAIAAAEGPDVGALADAVPLGTFYGEPAARHRWRSLGAFTALKARLGGAASLRTTASLARYTLARDALDLDSLVRRAGAPFVARTLKREGLRFTYLKGGSFLDVRVRTGLVRHALTVGAEAIRAWAQADGSAPLVPDGRGGFLFAAIAPVALENPQPAGVPAAADRVDYLDASVRGLDLGLFVQDRATVSIGAARLHAVASARLSHVRAVADIFALADTPDAPAGLSTRRFAVTAVTPAGGLVAEVRPGVALYLSGGASFNPIVERVDRNGEPFRPTRGVQAEGGAKLDAFGGRLGASLAAFWIRKDDALTKGPGGFFDQTGRQRSRGVEAEARGEPVRGLTVLASYAFLDAVVVEDDNLAAGTSLPYAPRHSGSVWAEGRPRAGWAVRGGVWAEGARRGSLTADLVLPAQASVDVGAEAPLGRGVALRLDARNVLGVRGYSAAEALPGLDGGRLLVAWPTPGREVRLGIVLRR